ncbi:hypothetical protein [Quadrisphaera sp. DSM 44207]|uniref:hypothetical protein n=1 Tax=Quadrisphaera sp. DSM 44207 TaxID=1881057 RepID=UPI00087E00E9|nr:hypothetical protein [Quadrisphaera sp. DSM 44207]SDQ38729.1 hypothetical protein SAMN05428996_1501 [Quadrisphaera sp. DSM 44207]
MICLRTARALRASGLPWEPGRGDRFVILDRDMDADVFVLSDMTIEAHAHPSGRVLGFNGTTEWALDSVAAEQALWLPRESQLRELLGPAFCSLERLRSGPEDGAVAVVVEDGAGVRRVVDEDVEEAYALALLSVRARTARDLLPVAAAALARRLRALPRSGGCWEAAAPGGARVRDVVADVTAEHRWAQQVLAGLRPGTGAPVDEDAVPAWEAALQGSLTGWAALEDLVTPVPLGSGPVPAGELAEQLLLGLLLATWDVARACGLEERLDPVCAARAVAHLRAGAPGPDAQAQAPAPDAAAAGEDAQRVLLALTGRAG